MNAVMLGGLLGGREGEGKGKRGGFNNYCIIIVIEKINVQNVTLLRQQMSCFLAKYVNKISGMEVLFPIKTLTSKIVTAVAYNTYLCTIICTCALSWH